MGARTSRSRSSVKAADEKIGMEPKSQTNASAEGMARVETMDLGDIALEAAIPRSAIYRMVNGSARYNDIRMSELKSGMLYREGGGRGWSLTSGSRAEGLTLEDDWGHEDADKDVMWLYGGPLGVYVPGGQQPQGRSCLDFHLEGCPPAYCKLGVSDVHGLKKSVVGWERWCDDSCIEESGSVTFLNTFNTMRCINHSISVTRGKSVSGPASQYRKYDIVNTLVCSDALPDPHHEFRRRTRGPWPTADMINYILQLPMLLVLVGHKLSPEFRLQARMSWSHLEYKLIKELPESVRQGYIACKYVMKRFLRARRGETEYEDGRSLIGSFHIKSAFLHFLEKRPLSLIKSPFDLFLQLLAHLDVYVQVGKLPHYFLPQCDLLETVGNDERHLAHQAIQDILSDPLNALLTSPTDPQQLYGDVNPEHLVVAFKRVSAHPKCEQSCKDLSELLARVDARRREKFRVQQESDDDVYHRVSGRPELIGLLATMEQMKHI